MCLLRGHIWLLCELARLLRKLLLTSRCKLRRLLPKLSRLLGRLRLPELWRLRPGLLLGRLETLRLPLRPGLILLWWGSVLRRLRAKMWRCLRGRGRVHRGSGLRWLQAVIGRDRRDDLVRRLALRLLTECVVGLICRGVLIIHCGSLYRCSQVVV